MIHGDCSSHATLEQQGISACDAVVTLTGNDESNMVISLFAGSRGVPQIITKLSRGENTSIADGQAEAVEFSIDPTTKNCGVPLKKIKLRPHLQLWPHEQPEQAGAVGRYAGRPPGDLPHADPVKPQHLEETVGPLVRNSRGGYQPPAKPYQ